MDPVGYKRINKNRKEVSKRIKGIEYEDGQQWS
jgi:hypothetical protein